MRQLQTCLQLSWPEKGCLWDWQKSYKCANIGSPASYIMERFDTKKLRSEAKSVSWNRSLVNSTKSTSNPHHPLLHSSLFIPSHPQLSPLPQLLITHTFCLHSSNLILPTFTPHNPPRPTSTAQHTPCPYSLHISRLLYSCRSVLSSKFCHTYFLAQF